MPEAEGCLTANLTANCANYANDLSTNLTANDANCANFYFRLIRTCLPARKPALYGRQEIRSISGFIQGSIPRSGL